MEKQLRDLLEPDKVTRADGLEVLQGACVCRNKEMLAIIDDLPAVGSLKEYVRVPREWTPVKQETGMPRFARNTPAARPLRPLRR